MPRHHCHAGPAFCRRVSIVLAVAGAWLLGSGSGARPAQAEDLRERVAAVKSAKNARELRERLVAVGFSAGLLDGTPALREPADEPVLDVKNLRRAEAWEVNLTPSADKERVVQVQLQTEPEAMAFTAVYLILVMDSAGNRLTEHAFAQSGCDYASDKTMSFSFVPVPKRSYQHIRFVVDDTSSCGLIIDGTVRRDVLSWNERTGKLELRRGKPKPTGRINRMDLAQ